MKNIETSPFNGKFKGFGGKSYDSVAGVLQAKSRQDETVAWKNVVLKWNRAEIPTVEDAKAIATFRRKSIQLYQQTLGEEFIVPTNIVIGNKRDLTGLKYKVYQVQPFVSGWTGKEAPEEVLFDSEVVSQWKILSRRLYRLYQTANQINSGLSTEFTFPITMTLGDSRQLSFTAGVSDRVPLSKNILIGRDDLRLSLFDFGVYFPWQETMQEAYDKILQSTNTKNEVIVFKNEAYTGCDADKIVSIDHDRREELIA